MPIVGDFGANRKAVEQRFWSKVLIIDGDPFECWLWTRSRDKQGYGRFGAPWGSDRAHRVAWMLIHGPIGKDICVCHRCDTPACCNPHHLFLGTHADNVADCVAKGRQRVHTTRLTPDAVRAVRQAATKGHTQSAIARQFGVTQATVSKLLLGQTWRHVRS